MADNTVLPGSGETYASKDDGTAKIQRVMISDGSSSTSSGDIDSANGFPVLSTDGNAPYLFKVQSGDITGASVFDAFGENTDLDTGVEEDLWAAGGTYVYPTSATVFRFVSSSANDTSAGTGARTGTMTYLDASFDIQTETITLNGTTNVDSIASGLRMLTFVIETAGTTEAAEGIITITAVTGGATQGLIAAGNNETRLTQHTVPNGKTAYLLRFYINNFSNSTVTVKLMIRKENGVFITLREISTAAVHLPITLPFIKILSKSDIVMRATSSGNNATVSGGYDILDIDD